MTIIRAYAALSYLLYLGTLAYVIGWLADVGVPKGISDGSSRSAWTAVLVDLAVLAVFAIQHSVMGRPGFKSATRAVIPQAAERATYVLLSSAAVVLVVWQWRPLNTEMWDVAPSGWRVVLWGAYAAGWLVSLLSSFMIGHFDLFGLKQAIRGAEYREPDFGRPGFYALVRHPIMTGFIVAFWATPSMTVGHLLFAAVSTAYIVVAVRLEERDLRAGIGPSYDTYAREVPRFMPAVRRRRAPASPPSPSLSPPSAARRGASGPRPHRLRG